LSVIHYENKQYQITPKKDFLEALRNVRQLMQQEGKEEYLHHIVITRDKKLDKIIIYPNF